MSTLVCKNIQHSFPMCALFCFHSFYSHRLWYYVNHENESDLRITTDTLYPAFTGELRVCIVRIGDKNDRFITAPDCICPPSSQLLLRHCSGTLTLGGVGKTIGIKQQQSTSKRDGLYSLGINCASEEFVLGDFSFINVFFNGAQTFLIPVLELMFFLRKISPL